MATGLGGACGPPKPLLVDFSDTTRDYRSAEYGAVYRRWTRHTKLTRDMNPAIEVWGTLKSSDLREAYVEHYGQVYGLTAAERERLRVSERESARTVYEFHLVAQSVNYEWVDFEKRGTTPWRLSLVDGTGREVAPDVVKLIKLPDAYQEEFFPERTPFSKTYVLQFPREGTAGAATSGFMGGRTGRITLRIASPLGRAELVWQSS